MNPNVVARMGSGTGYSGYLGIRGIQAVSRGPSEFFSFADELDAEWGAASVRRYLEASAVLPNQGYLLYPNKALLFSQGASSSSHGNEVLMGLIEANVENECHGYNVRAYRNSLARWSEFISSFLRRVTHCYVFGHSFGGVAAECFSAAFSRLCWDTSFITTTYGCPRYVNTRRKEAARNHSTLHYTHAHDVVSHVPYWSSEAPYASAAALPYARAAFDASGHGQWFWELQFNGTGRMTDYTTMSGQSITMSTLAWVTYAQHLSSRDHELGTYVSTMAQLALRSEDGSLPPAAVIPPPVVPPPTPPTSPPPTPPTLVVPPLAAVVDELLQAELDAANAYRHQTPVKPARAVVRSGIVGVEFLGSIRVRASASRSARNLARRLNKLRRLMGPLTTEQRADFLAAIQDELAGQD